MSRGVRRYALFLVSLLLASAVPVVRAADSTALGRALAGIGPNHGWAMEESLRVFAGNSLYDLVDGGAALYLEYGFERAYAMSFRRQESRISVEVYAMSGPEAAFGLYSYLAAGSTSGPASYGEEGGAGEGFIVFWKGSCAVTVTTLQGEVSDALPAFAAAVDRILPAGGERPESARVLGHHRGAAGVVSFRGPLGYQKRRGLLGAELLRVGGGASASLDSCDAAVLLYPDPDASRRVLRKALDSLARQPGAQIDRSGDGALIRIHEEFYSLQCAGSRLLQVHGSSRVRVQRLAARLRSAF